MKKQYRVIITPGEPAGVGPDIIIQISQFNWPVELVICADISLLQERSKMLNLPLIIIPYESLRYPIPQKAGTITILHTPLRVPAIPGKLHIENSFYVLETLSRACDGSINGEFSAFITGPVHKGIINEAGILFTGHTEFLKERSNTHRVVMMLMNEKMRVALATTHLPIKSISDTITKELLYETISILHDSLYRQFGIQNPRILVCGLNPHAGESGFIGTEEIDIIIPVIEVLSRKGINLIGPIPADTLFQPKYLDHSDAILAMYHDQGLPVVKYQGLNRSVNITLGLPFIRTSVDHGTALDLAGLGKANIESFMMAIDLAVRMVLHS